MSTSRLSVALAIIGAFVAGIGVGSFIGSGPLVSGRSTNGAARSGGLFPSSAPRGTAGDRSQDVEGTPDGEPLEGEELVKRLWTALTIGDENERHAEWLRLLPLLNRTEAMAVRELFRRMDAQGRHFDFEWFSFWPKWGEVDGAGALEYLADNENAGWRPAAAEMLVRGWAKADPNAARAWLSANSASPFYEGALRGYLDGLARSDLARATSEALILGAGKDMSKLMEVVTEQALQQRQLTGMLDWWRTLPDDASDGSARRAAIEYLYARLQFADPARAEAWVSELAATPYRNDHQVGEVAEKMAARDPAHAVEWVASLPPSGSDGHYTAIGRTMRAWGEKDAPAAEAWLNALPASPLRDQALVSYARFLQGSQPEAAEQWLAQVQDRALIQSLTPQQLIYNSSILRLQSIEGTIVNGGELIIQTSPPQPQ